MIGPRDPRVFAPDFLSPSGGPSEAELKTWRRAAQSGKGTPWLDAGRADALARYALKFGEGVQMMEAVATRFREPVRDVGWEIIGADAEGENWEDHRDPQRAYALMRAKLRAARNAGAVLEYKLWLKRAGT
ncbi:hypothetical protein [uncultured Mameliella sp.]|uniref:hypothetical protein n=1 Tax=uncultured Mameliella sp. TaxID=1447087 RepID=UPI00262C5B1E|nr:hypothetical protein [uncultured Mameliella sp.]